MLLNLLIRLINFFISLFVGAIAFFINILPDSPFNDFDLSLPTNIVANINYIIPFTEIIVVLGLWVACLTVYFIAHKVAHFLHLT